MSLSLPTILVVDDVPANLSVLLDLLTDAGFAVLVADSGERALLQVSHRRPDLILLDAMMPGLDGFETCRRLKADPATRDLPVLFMTALTDTAACLSGFAAGAVDYISKPFESRRKCWPGCASSWSLAIGCAATWRPRYVYACTPKRGWSVRSPRRCSSPTPMGSWFFAPRAPANCWPATWTASIPKLRLPAALLGGQPIPRPSGSVRLRARRFAAETGGEEDEQGLIILLLREEAPDPSLMLMSALNLTEREAEVLYWVAQGKTSPEIAIILGTAPKTIKKHLERVYRKLGVETRASAAVQASEVLGRHALP